eukprot:NODE_2540_length_1174_cov_20.576000_g2321_i0.p1 GENE.NODE_2540_length_1174_cov_20.576000_g2321_i0~~NODE_2540_length_1174_cov_20.576000_g2321_i0.p1  ORF type:complete len:362 (-),score=65.31 NODE_2540_length_1174_cov_20.576000_g2321_i0:87-1091(-)
MRGSIVIVDPTGCGLFTNIQDAFDRCQSGDTIIVRKGVYTSPLTLNKAGIIVQGSDCEETIIENKSDASVVVFLETATLRNITLVQRRRDFCCVRFEQGEGILEDCDVTSVNHSCVIISDPSRPTVRGCRIHHSKQHGIAIRKNAVDAMIIGNRIFANSQPNVMIEDGADPHLQDNIIFGSNQNGIWIKARGRGRIIHNHIFHNGYSNIDILEDAAPIIERNLIHGSAKCGICVAERGRGNITENDIHSNGYSNIGIMLGAYPQVTKNSIHHSKQHGIFAKSGAQGVLQDNNVFANALANIKLEDSAVVVHSNNQNSQLRLAIEHKAPEQNEHP